MCVCENCMVTNKDEYCAHLEYIWLQQVGHEFCMVSGQKQMN